MATTNSAVKTTREQMFIKAFYLFFRIALKFRAHQSAFSPAKLSNLSLVLLRILNVVLPENIEVGNFGWSELTFNFCGNPHHQ